MDHEGAGGVEEVAGAAGVLLAGADDLGRLHVEAEGEARDRAVVGDGDRAAEGLGEGAGVGEVGEVALDRALVGEVALHGRVEVPLVGEPEHEHRQDQPGECLPAPPPRVAGLEQSPAEQGDGDEDRQHRGAEHRVAGDDRQAGGGEERERPDRERGRGQAEGRAAAQEGEAEDDAARGADHPRPLQHFAERPRAPEDEVDRAGVAGQRVDGFAGAGERVGGAAGCDPVE